MKLLLRCLLLGAWVVSPSLWAWSNHTVGSYLALRELAAIREAPEVEVEPLEAFLAAERGGLAALLDEQEAYARAHIGNYPARPDALRFAAEGEAGDLRQAFLAALRVNPEIRLALAIQPLPGQDQPQRPHLKPQEVLVFQNLAVDRLAFHPPGARRASRAWQCWPPPPTNRTTATTSTCSATTPARPASATASAPSHSATRASSSAPRRRSTWASTTRRR